MVWATPNKASQPHRAPGVPCAAHMSLSSPVLPARPASPPAPLSWQFPEARCWHFTPSLAFWVQRVGCCTSSWGQNNQQRVWEAQQLEIQPHMRWDGAPLRTPIPWGIEQGVAQLLGLEQYFG